MDVIRYYEIVTKVYHGEPVCRLRFERNGSIEETQLYTPSEINNIISLWQQGALMGSFGIGSILEKGAGFTLCAE